MLILRKIRVFLLYSNMLLVVMSIFGILNAASFIDIQELQCAINASNVVTVGYILKRTTFSPDELRTACDTAEQVYQHHQQSFLGKLSSKQRTALAAVSSIGVLISLSIVLKDLYLLGNFKIKQANYKDTIQYTETFKNTLEKEADKIDNSLQ